MHDQVGIFVNQLEFYYIATSILNVHTSMALVIELTFTNVYVPKFDKSNVSTAITHLGTFTNFYVPKFYK